MIATEGDNFITVAEKLRRKKNQISRYLSSRQVPKAEKKMQWIMGVTECRLL